MISPLIPGSKANLILNEEEALSNPLDLKLRLKIK